VLINKLPPTKVVGGEEVRTIDNSLLKGELEYYAVVTYCAFHLRC